MADPPGTIRTTHKDGQVIITLDGDTGPLAHTKLDPAGAFTHAQQVIKHADLAREQQMEEARRG